MKPAIRPLKLNDIRITDELWSHYRRIVDEVALPLQLSYLEAAEPEGSGCLQNFRIAAGQVKGERSGVVFLDTDLYKWLEAASYAIESGGGRNFENRLDELIELIAQAQQPDGYINTYYTIVEPQKRFTNLIEGHELYSAGHLIEAAVAHFRATGKRNLLEIAVRFADLICKTFGPNDGQLHGYPGHQEIELALVRLCHATGEKRYLDCAEYFINERGKTPNYFKQEIDSRGVGYEFFPEFDDYDPLYSQAQKPVREQSDADGHAVRCMYMGCAMSDIALEKNDKALLEGCERIWESIATKRMFITGGIGSSGIMERFTCDYDLPNSSAYCETCAAIGLALFSRRLAAIERDAKYYDVAERALFNNVLSGINADGRSFFYVNPLEVWPDACLDKTSLSHIKPVRQKWYPVACCPTNTARTLMSLGEYIYGASENTEYINLFIASSASAKLERVSLHTELECAAYTSGKVTIKVTADADGAQLAVRIPHYAVNPVFTFNGAASTPRIEKGYAYFPLSAGVNEIAADFHVQPRFEAADSRVRADAGKTALTYGPAVYCLEQTDNGENLSQIAVSPETEIDVASGQVAGVKVPVLSYDGERIRRCGDELYAKASYEKRPVRLRAVPYGVWGNRENGEMLVWQRALGV